MTTAQQIPAGASFVAKSGDTMYDVVGPWSEQQPHIARLLVYVRHPGQDGWHLTNNRASFRYREIRQNVADGRWFPMNDIATDALTDTLN
jgi:hypothetical protein